MSLAPEAYEVECPQVSIVCGIYLQEKPKFYKQVGGRHSLEVGEDDSWGIFHGTACVCYALEKTLSPSEVRSWEYLHGGKSYRAAPKMKVRAISLDSQQPTTSRSNPCYVEKASHWELVEEFQGMSRPKLKFYKNKVTGEKQRDVPAIITRQLSAAAEAIPVGSQTGGNFTHVSEIISHRQQLQQHQQKDLTDQDRVALETFLASYTPAVGAALHSAKHLNEIAGKIAAHDRALHLLVNKQKECPSLFWFYPKKREFRNWLNNPLKCLFQDSLMMVVVCPVTLCVVKCGPDEVGWEIRSPKTWVKKWGPAILASIYVMQTAVLAGRIVGIPLPTLPSVGEMTNVLGLHTSGGVLKDGMSAVTDQVSAENLMNSLQGFASVTEQCLEEHKTEMGGLIHKMQLQQQQQQQRRQNQSSNSTAPPPHEEITLGTDMPTAMIGASYHSIHTFLTTGENAMLGKLEDQLRGSMERVMADDGEVEWVSVQAVDAWKQMHSAVKVPPIPSPPSAFAPYDMHVLRPCVSVQPPDLTVASRSWLAVRLRTEGATEETIVRCERILIDEEEYRKEHHLGTMLHSDFTVEYLRSIGITARGLQQQLFAIHRELALQYQGALPSSAPVSPFSPDSAASFTSDEKDAVQRELASLKSELSEIKSKSGKNASPVPNQVGSNNSSGGGGGLKQKQRNEASTINPLTGQEYSMDELILKIAALEANVNSAQRDIGHLGSVVMTHDVDLEDHASYLNCLKDTNSHLKPHPTSSLPSQEHVDQKSDLLRKY